MHPPWTALLCLPFCLPCSAETGESLGPNLLSNGDFESGGLQWWYPAERYGGEVDSLLRHGGINSWRMDLTGAEHEVFLSKGGKIERGRDHRVAVWVRCKDVKPDNGITVRAQQFGGGKPGGWYVRQGIADIVHTGGSHGWFQFAFNIPDADLAEATDRLTLYLRASAGTTGTVWFDDVTLQPVVGEAPGELLDAQAAPPLSLAAEAATTDDAAAFRDIPFLDKVGEGVSIDCGSDHNLDYGIAPRQLTIKLEEGVEGELDWIVTDYFGRKSLGGRRSSSVRLGILKKGYFEIAARLTRDGKQLGAARTSFARMAKHPLKQTAPGFPLGSWVQQNDLLDDLGARWTRVGTGWRYLEPKKGEPNEALWHGLDESVAGHVKAGRNPIFLFAKVPSWAGPHYKRVGSDHWEDFRAYVRKCVERYRKQVDLWEVMNEPYIPTLFPGTLEEVMQWHRIVREEVDRGDPGAKVLGPCLNPRRDYLFEETRDLLELGLGKLVDGYSIHTYGGLEADGFLDDLEKLRALHREFDADKPLYITEQGLSVPEKLPHERLQAQYLVRMMLLCMQANVRAVIWHMMSWPQGPNAEQRNFALVRARQGSAQRAPRPAFVAAAVLSSVLGKARFVRALDGFPETVGAQLYEGEGGPIHVLWEWGQPEREVEVDVGAEQVTVINIVGNGKRRKTAGGRLKLTLTPDPVYVIRGSLGTPAVPRALRRQ